MRLPFGLDFMSLIVGALLAYFVVPWILGRVSSMTARTQEA